MYESNNTGLQMDKTKEFAYDPTLFKLKSNSELSMLQVTAAANTYQDVIFSDIDFVVKGDLSYDGQVVTYNGLLPMDMVMNLSCSVDSSQPSTIVHIAQAQNGVIDPGTESSAKCETITALQSLNTASYFTMQPGDTLNLKYESDKQPSVIGIHHIQVVLKQIEVPE